MNERAKTILNFWFKETTHKERFKKNEAFDAKIRNRFFKDYQKAANNEYDNWQNNTKECLALIILLDQFSRNLFRNNGKAFALDNKLISLLKNIKHVFNSPEVGLSPGGTHFNAAVR